MAKLTFEPGITCCKATALSAMVFSSRGLCTWGCVHMSVYTHTYTWIYMGNRNDSFQILWQKRGQVTSAFVDSGFLLPPLPNRGLANQCHGHLSPYVAQVWVKGAEAWGGTSRGVGELSTHLWICSLVVTLAPRRPSAARRAKLA